MSTLVTITHKIVHLKFFLSQNPWMGEVLRGQDSGLRTPHLLPPNLPVTIILLLWVQQLVQVSWHVAFISCYLN